MPIFNNILAGSGQSAAADLGETIDQSLRFKGNVQSNVLSLTQTATTINDDKNFTFATWFKLTDFGETCIFGFHSSTSENWILRWQTTNNTFDTRFGSSVTAYDTSARFRDTSAWYHLLLQCTNGALDLYVNGTKTDTQIPSSFHSTGFDRPITIGAETTGGSTAMEGYLAETYFVQGSQLHPVNDGFIRLNNDGIYVPDTPTISSYGDNGFHLTYDSTQTNGIGHDSSGQNHHLTASGFDTAAITTSNEDNDIDYNDTPTNNHATLNLLKSRSATLNFEHANLRVQYGSGGSQPGMATMAFTGGKFYFEATPKVQVECDIGIVSDDYILENDNAQFGETPNGWAWRNSATAHHNGVTTDPSHTAFGVDDTVGFLIDTEAGTAKIEVNGAAQSNSEFTNIPSDKLIYPFFRLGGGSGDANIEFNFGQMPFLHQPSGYEAISSNNQTEPAVKEGNKHFGVLTYTTPGSPSFPITIDGSGGNNGDGVVDFDQAPDMVWFKMTNGASEGVIFDSLRGAGGYLQPRGNHTTINVSSFAFANNGFTFSSQEEQYYRQNDAYVAYCWKAGGAPTATNTENAGASQTAGSVKVDGADGSFAHGTIAVKKMSVNTTAGFSIVQYEGTGSNGSIPHGLGAVPKWVITKRFDGPGNWENYHVSIGNTATIRFDLTDGQTGASATYWNNTTPTDTVVTLGGGGANNSTGEDMIAYCFAEVPGYSKFGKYTGLGSGSNPDYDGPFEYLGFKPAWLMVKRTNVNGDEWTIWNSHRDPNNFAFKAHRIGAITPESSGDTFAVDLLANGFKIRSSAATINSTGSDYIYMAFAEHPFGGENAAPVTAR